MAEPESSVIALPPYLASSSALVKALKALHDPPNPDWPTKIEIATQALNESSFILQRKESVLREWILEEFSKVKGTKVKSMNPLLKPDYYRLLSKLISGQDHDASNATTYPIQSICHGLYASMVPNADKLEDGATLLDASATLLQIMDDRKPQDEVSGKAEIWLDALRLLLEWISERFTEASESALKQHIDLISRELAASLDLVQNQRKITQMLPSVMAVVAQTYLDPKALESHLETPIKAIFYSFSILHQESSSITYSLSYLINNSKISAKEKLRNLPYQFKLLGQALYANRYTLFPPNAARSSVPNDVYVSNKVGEALLTCTAELLKTVDELSPGTEFEEARCEAKKGIWEAMRLWSGYISADEGWTKLISSTAAGLHTRINEVDEQVQGLIFETLTVLLELDTPSCDASARGSESVEYKAALAREDNLESATGLFCQTINYHVLTHTSVDFAKKLRDIMHHATLAGVLTVQESTYRATTGPLLQPDFQYAYRKSIEDVLSGGVTEDGDWATIFGTHAEWLHTKRQEMVNAYENQSTQEQSITKKRKKNDESIVNVGTPSDGTISQVAGEIGLASRFIVILLETVYEHGFEDNEVVKAVIEKYSALWAPADADFPTGYMLDDWTSSIFTGSILRMATAASKFKETPELPKLRPLERKTVEKWSAAAEESYERALAYLNHAEQSGSLDNEAEEFLWSMLETPDRSESWDGLSAQIKSTSLPSALWQVLARSATPIVEAYASDDFLEKFAKAIVTPDLRSEKKDAESFTELTARSRLVLTADLWECSRMQAAIEKYLTDILQETGEVSKQIMAIGFLVNAPSEFIGRSVRNLSVANSYRVEADLETEKRYNECALLRTYLAKVINETGYLGNPSLTDLPRYFDCLDNHEDESTALLRAVTENLITAIWGALLRDLRKPDNLAFIMDAGLRCAENVNLTNPKFCGAAYMLEICPRLKIKAASLPEAVTKVLRLVQDILCNATFPIVTKAKEFDEEKAKAMDACITHLKWSGDTPRGVGNLTSDSLSLLLQTVGRADNVEDQKNQKVIAKYAAVGLRLVLMRLAEAKITDLSQWLGVWIDLTDRFQTQAPGVLEDVYEESIEDLNAEQFDSLLNTLITQLDVGRYGRSSKDLIVLFALERALQSYVPISVEKFKHKLSLILSRLREYSAAKVESGLKVRVLEVLVRICEQKPAVLTEQDASEIIYVVSSVLKPCATLREKTPNHQPFELSLQICSALVRHRRDLCSNLLPQLMRVYSATFALFGQPRANAKSGRLRSIMMNCRPYWLASTDDGGLNETDAAALSRALTTLTGKTTIKRANNAADSEKDQGTLVGQLSKHAPAILVAYTKACTNELSGIPLAIRKEMEPGLLAVCEAITAGGRAHYGKTPGEGVGEPFGLAESANRDAEYEIWGELWQTWGAKRYTGQG